MYFCIVYCIIISQNLWRTSMVYCTFTLTPESFPDLKNIVKYGGWGGICVYIYTFVFICLILTYTSRKKTLDASFKSRNYFILPCSDLKVRLNLKFTSILAQKQFSHETEMEIHIIVILLKSKLVMHDNKHKIRKKYWNLTWYTWYI